MKQISHDEVFEAAVELANIIKRTPLYLMASPIRLFKIYGVPRGGVFAVYAVSKFLPNAEVVDQPDCCDVIIDDVIDSGRTKDKFESLYPNTPFLALFVKDEHDKEWLQFPWENDEEFGSASDIPIRLIQYVGEDPDREGLRDTPRRFLDAFRFYTKGYVEKPADFLTTFRDDVKDFDQMIFQGAIPMWSLCEHHLSPFFGLAHIGYIPNGKMVGLSKLARVVDMYARRFQIQERLTDQIAECLHNELNPVGVGVVLECRHTCIESRGVQKMGTVTVTSALRGAIKGKPDARAEFLEFVKIARRVQSV